MALHDAYTAPRAGSPLFCALAELWKCLFTKQPSIRAIVPRPYTVTAPWTEWDIARVRCFTNETQRIVNRHVRHIVIPYRTDPSRSIPQYTPLVLFFSLFSFLFPLFFFFFIYFTLPFSPIVLPALQLVDDNVQCDSVTFAYAQQVLKSM